jgi:hypothetical protein
MVEVVVIVGAIAWLGMGGWAFGRLGSTSVPLTPDQAGGLAIVCGLFGPFMAGWALSMPPDEGRDPTPPSRGEGE